MQTSASRLKRRGDGYATRLDAAESKAQAEDGFRRAVRDGAKPSEAFARYRVL